MQLAVAASLVTQAVAAAGKQAFAAASMALSMAKWKPASKHATIHGEEQVVRCSICGGVAVAWRLGSMVLSVARSCSLVVRAQEKNNELRREKAIKNKTFTKGRNLHYVW